MLVDVKDVVNDFDLDKLRELEKAINFFACTRYPREQVLRDRLGLKPGFWATMKAEIRKNPSNVAMGGLWYFRYEGYALDFEIQVSFDGKNWSKGMEQLKVVYDAVMSRRIIEIYKEALEMVKSMKEGRV